MNNTFGNNAVSGEDFHGREEFVKHIKGILLAKNSLLLLGLRRTGKSSSLKEVSRQIKEENKDVVLIELNCQNYESLNDFYKNLHLALPKDWQDKLKSLLKASQRIPTKIIDFITDHIEEVNLGEIASIKFRNEVISYSNVIKEELTNFFRNEEKHIILIIDELPFLFENIVLQNPSTTKLEIEMVLTTLRSWRDIGISQALCGSLNLHLQMEALGLSRKLLGGISTQSLPKYTIEEAKGLLTKLATSGAISLSEENLNKIIELHPDCIPQFLQLFFFSLRLHWDKGQSGIKEVYDKYVYPGIAKDFEYQFQERYAKMAKEDIKLAKEVLNHIYKTPSISESKLLQSTEDEDVYRILLLLASQEFIVKDVNQCYDFSFEIVRNWWKKKTM